MIDPYLKDHDAYLNSLHRFSAPKRDRNIASGRLSGKVPSLQSLAAAGVAFATLAFLPWGG